MNRFVAVLLATLASTAAQAATVNTVVMQGQSNIVGPEPASDYRRLPADRTVDYYYEIGRKSQDEPDGLEFEAPKGDDASLPRFMQKVDRRPTFPRPVKMTGLDEPRMGIEVNLGRALRSHYGAAAKIAIVKCGYGSASMADWLYSSTVSFGDLCLMQLWQVKRIIEAAGDTMEVRALVWHQGVADTNEHALAERRQENLTLATDKVRKFAGKDNLAVILLRTYIDMSFLSSAEQAQRGPLLNLVRQGESDFTQADPCTVNVNRDDLTYKDAFHEAPSAIPIEAQKVFKAFKNLTARPACQ